MTQKDTTERGSDAPPQTFKFIVDEGHFESSQQQLTGAQLRTIAHIDPSLQLFEEVHGPGSDLQIEDQTVVTLMEHGETHFYTMPRANMG